MKRRPHIASATIEPSPPQQSRTVRPEARPIVELRPTWDSPWLPYPWVRAVSAEIHSAYVGHSTATLEHRYGRMSHPGLIGWVDEPREDHRGEWVRISLAPTDVDAFDLPPGDAVRLVPIWCGFVVKQVDRPDLDVSSPRGTQTMIATGAERLLEQIDVCSSFWRHSGLAGRVVELDRPPRFNDVRRGGQVVGNRTAEKWNGCHHFGGDAVWTHRDILEYLFVHYLLRMSSPELPSRGPRWMLSGQLAALDTFASTIVVDRVMTLRRLLDMVIPASLGVDYVVRYAQPPQGAPDADDGFSLHVFSLQPEPTTAGGYTLPGNPWRYRVDRVGEHDAAFSIETCQSTVYRRIEVRGRPIVVCRSAGHGSHPGFMARWESLLREDYDSALGWSGPNIRERNDAYRADDRFRDVYQAYATNGTQGGLASPATDDTGELVLKPWCPDDRVRASLSWLPLYEGWDYTTDPPTAPPASNRPLDYRPPLVLVFVEDKGVFVPVEQLSSVGKVSGSVSALHDAWGVRVRTSPNHAMARHSAATLAPSTFDAFRHAVDYRMLSFTFAHESDYVVRVAADLPPQQQAAPGSTLVIERPDCELHLLLPRTVLGVNLDGTLRLSPDHTVILRDDRDKLRRDLVGAVARHLATRARATVRYVALVTGHVVLGSILQAVVLPGGDAVINGACTSAVWDFRRRTTEISTGHAQE